VPSILSEPAQTKCGNALRQVVPQPPGVYDCIKLNELKMEQTGESLENNGSS
jgi:hypothetical protein